MNAIARNAGARPNHAKRKMQSGKACLGLSLRHPSEQVVEIAAALGVDFVVYEIEHEIFDLRDIAAMTRAADLNGITAIARIGKAHFHMIDPLLGVGVQGFCLARVKSGADIEELASRLYFHPLGKRTYYGGGRSANHAIGIDADSWAAACNQEILIHAIIEEEEAIRNLDDILAHPLLDVIECGPSDLRQSMGLPAPEVIAKTEAKVFERSVKAGKWILDTSSGASIADNAWRYLSKSKGSMLLVSANGILTAALADMVETVRQVNG